MFSFWLITFQGCEDEVHDYLDKWSGVVTGILIAIAVLQVLCFLFGVCLTCIKKDWELNVIYQWGIRVSVPRDVTSRGIQGHVILYLVHITEIQSNQRSKDKILRNVWFRQRTVEPRCYGFSSSKKEQKWKRTNFDDKILARVVAKYLIENRDHRFIDFTNIYIEILHLYRKFIQPDPSKIKGISKQQIKTARMFA
jgi:hypothetical protein